MRPAISYLLLVNLLLAPIAAPVVAQRPHQIANDDSHEIDTYGMRLNRVQPAQFEGSGTRSASPTTRGNGRRSVPPAIRGRTAPPTSSAPISPNRLESAPVSPYTDENLIDQSPIDDRVSVPVLDERNTGTIRVQQGDNTISLYVKDASLHHVISMVAKASGLNIVVTEQASEQISITLNQVPFDDALDAILSVGGYTSTMRNNILFVSKVKADRIPAGIQGRVMEIFTLDYAAADDVQAAVQGMLSPAGTTSISRSDSTDHRRTRELVVVEDLPNVVERVRRYVHRIDIPPRQVLIEAHILQVDLGDELRHGVNIERLAEVAGGDLSLEVRGFANQAASQGFVATLDGNDVGAVIEAIKTTNETKTLASPKVLVVNGQDAHLQVGEQLAYRTTLTTQTATQETIQFLPIGVVLDVRPQISRDGRILMYVRPKVSSGRINPDNQLPEERKTEVETDVLLKDGEGLVIGGLIQETTSNDQAKVPWLGDLHKVGLLFQRKAREINRSEIIVTLIPRIVPIDHSYGQPDNPPYYRESHRKDYERANTRLTRGSIYRNSRDHLEQPMVDACENGTRLGDALHNSRPYDTTSGYAGVEALPSDLYLDSEVSGVGDYGRAYGGTTYGSEYHSDGLSDGYVPNEYESGGYEPVYEPNGIQTNDYPPIDAPYYDEYRTGRAPSSSNARTNRSERQATSNIRRLSHEQVVNPRTNRPTRSVRLESPEKSRSFSPSINRYSGRLQGRR